MYDCVYPTRTARFGTALVSTGQLKLKQKRYANDMSPLDPDVPCYVSRNYTRAYLHRLIKRNDCIGAQLLTIHNIAYMMRLVRTMRKAILDQDYTGFTRRFMANMFPGSL